MMELISQDKVAVMKDGIFRIINKTQLNEYVDNKGYVELTKDDLLARAKASGKIAEK
jgi:sulfur transfer complex TusBCD TusB component (DsrH family)